MSYDLCPEAEKIAANIIYEWHPHLVGVAIAFIIKAPGNDGAENPKTAKAPRGGKALKLGSAAAVSEKYQLITDRDYEFIIELNGQYWDRLELDQQQALIDHELCHCRKDGDGFYLADHDLEEFRQIVRRHGFWKPDIQAFCEEAQPLFDKPGIQRRIITPPLGSVVVCGGEEIRVEETGEIWTYDVKAETFVRVETPEQKGARLGREAVASHVRVNELIDNVCGQINTGALDMGECTVTATIGDATETAEREAKAVKRKNRKKKEDPED